MATRRHAGPVERAVKRDLRRLLDPPARRSGLAEAAQVLARRLDSGATDRDAATIARELRATLVELLKRADAGQQVDAVDELQARRADRRRGA